MFNIYAYLPSICFFRSASKEDILWSPSGWNINLNWICPQFQIGFFTFLFGIFHLSLLDLSTVLIMIFHLFLDLSTVFTFLFRNFHLDFSVFLLDLSTVSNWIFHFPLVRITVPTWSKEFCQLVLSPNTQSKLIYDSYNQSRKLKKGFFDRILLFRVHFKSQMFQTWMQSMCLALTVLWLLGIASPFGKRVISVTCQ